MTDTKKKIYIIVKSMHSANLKFEPKIKIVLFDLVEHKLNCYSGFWH